MRSPPGARMGAGGLPGRAHPFWADSPPCTPSIWAAWVGVVNSVDDGAVNAKWLSGVSSREYSTNSLLTCLAVYRGRPAC